MNLKPEIFYSNGKLLLTGEYVVLDGALSLALPTKLGQSLTVEEIEDAKIIWESYDENGAIWYEDIFILKDLKSERQNHPNEISQRMIQILETLRLLKPEIFSAENGFKITTQLEFPRNWGLGTSSTLINNIANWAHVDAYKLLELTFGGSGYDIACAQHDSAITYQLLKGKADVKNVEFNPKFKDDLYFVYLNKKQNSRDGIAQYKENTLDLTKEISTINSITNAIIKCQTLVEFEDLINQHEQLISKIIKQKTIKDLLFSDFKGCIKSLGAWGGDFVLVTSEENPSNYFKSKGFDTILTFDELIK